MKRLSQPRKVLLVVLLALCLLGTALLLAVRAYLSSSHAAAQVASHLQAILGGRVEVEGAGLGLSGGSSLHGIQAYEEGQAQPWLEIGDVQADASIFRLLRGGMPDEVRIDGARITLRFDRDGRLLTHLPSGGKGPPRVPHLHIEQGQLTLDQEGRPPMVVEGINVDLVPGAEGLALTGTITDPFWGGWTANGSADVADRKGSVTLDTPHVQVNMDRLKRIAFVPPSVWQQVEIDGATPASVTLSFDSANGKPQLHYRVEVSPHDAHVRIPSIQLDADQATGKAVIVDKRVELIDVRGRVAQGIIRTTADLDFRSTPTALKFKVHVEDVVLHSLPKKWKVPPNIDGQLTGMADLLLTIQNGKVTTSGSGQGAVTQARLGWFHVRKPIRLALTSDGRRFRFHRPQPPVAAVPVALASPQESRIEDRGSRIALVRSSILDPRSSILDSWLAPTRLADLLGQGINLGVRQIDRAIDKTSQALAKLRKPSQPGQAPTYLDVNLGLDNVDVAQMIQGLKLKLPYAITGRLTFQVHASIPVNTPGDTKAYRFDGTAKLPRLNVAGLDMTNVEARVRYANGVLDLEQLRGQVPQPERPGQRKEPGTFQGSAHVDVVPEGDLRAELKIERIPLSMALGLLLKGANLAEGALSGTVTGRAPVAKLREPAAWSGSAKLHIADLVVQTLMKALPTSPIHLEGRVTGDLSGELAASAPGRKCTWTADIKLSEPLRVQGIPTQNLKGTLRSRGGAITYELAGDALDGKINLHGTLPPVPEQPKPPSPEGEGRLTVKGAQLARLWDAYHLPDGLSHLRGTFSITNLPFRHAGPRLLSADPGEFQIINVRWDGQVVSDSLRGPMRLTTEGVELGEVSGDVGQGLVRALVVFPLGVRRRGHFRLTLQQVEASLLLAPLPDVASHVSGPVDAHLTGQIDGEWSGGGPAVLMRGKVFGLDVTEWRLPLSFRFSPLEGAGEVSARDSTALIAQGRALGEAHLHWGNGLRLSSTTRFFSVDLRTLLRNEPSLASYVSGRMSGRLDLAGAEMRSVNDLTGTLQARLEQTQALQLPVLRQVAPYLRPGISILTFQSGDLKGRLANGIFRVQKLTLTSDLLALLIQGTVTLTGRLDLDVQARSGSLRFDPNRARDFNRRLPLVGAIPRALLAEITAFLANRLVHLRVTGTVQAPIIHLEPPVLLLTEEAVRFFLGIFSGMPPLGLP